MASSCIPGIFIPIENDGRMLVDGVLVENVPVSPLETMGADFIVAADVKALRLYKKPDDIIEVVMNAMDIAVDSLSIPKSDNVDLLIRPELSSYSRTDTDSKKITELIERGYQATIEKLDSSEGFVNQR
jgi:NTE family protein